MNNSIKLLLFIILTISLYSSCFQTNSKIKAQIVKTIEVKKPKDSIGSYLAGKLIDYKILFKSNLNNYYVKIQYEGGEVIYSDTIRKIELHKNHFTFELDVELDKFKNNKLKIKMLISSLEDDGDFLIDLALPILYRKCFVKHTYITIDKNRSEFEVNNGFIYDGIEYTNYALLSYKDERTSLH